VEYRSDREIKAFKQLLKSSGDTPWGDPIRRRLKALGVS